MIINPYENFSNYFFIYQHFIWYQDTVAVRIVDFVGVNLSLSFEENMAMYLMYIVCVCCIDVICLFLAHLSQRHKKAFLIRICQFHVVVVVVVGSVIVNSNQSFLCCQLFTFLSSGLERLGQCSLGDWESS